MPNKNLNLLRLKQILPSINQSHQSIATAIGLLSGSGLNSTQLLPEMCHLLQYFFNLTSCGFFWSDTKGNMQDAWSLEPNLLSFKTLMSCLEYQASDTRAWPTFQENVLHGAVAGYLLPFQNERFYASSHYASTFQTFNVRYVMDVVLHDGQHPHGAFLMMRSAQQGPFTPDERKLLAALIPIFNMAFSSTDSGETHYSNKDMTGFGLICQEGKFKSMCDEARRIVWMMLHVQPGSFANPNAPTLEDQFERLVAEHGMCSTNGKTSTTEVNNRWGKFTFSFEKDVTSGDTIVKLRRKVPLLSQLIFCLNKSNFPPMRQIIAWLLAQNQSRNEIAASLDLSVETVTSHIKLIYKAAETSSSHGLLLKLTR